MSLNPMGGAWWTLLAGFAMPKLASQSTSHARYGICFIRCKMGVSFQLSSPPSRKAIQGCFEKLERQAQLPRHSHKTSIPLWQDARGEQDCELLGKSQVDNAGHLGDDLIDKIFGGGKIEACGVGPRPPLPRLPGELLVTGIRRTWSDPSPQSRYFCVMMLCGDSTSTKR